MSPLPEHPFSFVESKGLVSLDSKRSPVAVPTIKIAGLVTSLHCHCHPGDAAILAWLFNQIIFIVMHSILSTFSLAHSF